MMPEGFEVGIVGAGVAGLAAALDVAIHGHKVYIIDKAPTIGGWSTRWSKLFPTDECSTCFSQFEMAVVANHPNIDIYTNTVVTELSGRIGAYTIKIKTTPRYVDPTKCIVCDKCTEVCPLELDNEYEVNLTKRKNIYTPFPQAIPHIPVVDETNMNYCRNECGKEEGSLCVKICPTDAVDLNMEPQENEFIVGAVIVATGFENYDAKGQYGYGKFENVITLPEIERYMASDGPTNGDLIVPSDKRTPESISFILCVGSRDPQTNKYCSRYCCMSTFKNIKQIKDRVKDAKINVYYKDIHYLSS